MLAATLFHKNKGRDFLIEANIFVEWLAFITFLAIGWIGAEPNVNIWMPP